MQLHVCNVLEELHVNDFPKHSCQVILRASLNQETIVSLGLCRKRNSLQDGDWLAVSEQLQQKLMDLKVLDFV